MTPRPDPTGSPQSKRPRERVHLAPVYWLLILIIVLTTILSIVWRDVQLIDRFGPNVATESLGILLTVVFVRRYMEYAERSRRLRSSAGALRKSRRALQDLIDAWSATFKGCMPHSREGELTRIEQLINAEQSELLLACDPSCPGPGRSGGRWVEWVGSRARETQQALDQIVANSGAMLDPEYVEALDALIADPFLRGFTELAAGTSDAQPWRVALNSVRAVRMAHFERLVSTVALHNRLVSDVGKVRGKVAAPRTSMIGVSLSPDHDLRIDTELDDGWWRSTPRPGTLRADRAAR